MKLSSSSKHNNDSNVEEGKKNIFR